MENNFDLPLLNRTITACAEQEVGTRGPDPTPEKSQKYRVLSNTVPDPQEKNTKLSSQHSTLCHHRPMMDRLLWYLDHSSPYKLQKALSKLDPTGSDQTFWIRAYTSILSTTYSSVAQSYRIYRNTLIRKQWLDNSAMLLSWLKVSVLLHPV